jgi:phosphatidylserine/phosphatidylglycerophosphate/cardiolipin synthase-like enzyme
MCLAACGSGESIPAEEETELFAPDGKADELAQECEAIQILAWLNDDDTTLAVIKDSGVHSRASKNIIKYRQGADEEIGTEDDEFFDDIGELDRVSWVGPRAFRQLSDAVLHRCNVEKFSQVFFSPQSYDDSYVARVVELVKGAKKSIDIAMYSFRETSVLDALQAAVERGVAVRFIFESANEHRKDPEGTMSAKIEDAGIDVRYINKIMHHKYAIFDGPTERIDDAFTATLVSGSGNWSSAAYRYDENMIEVKGDGELVLRYQKEFNHLWENSRDFVWVDSYQMYTTKKITDYLIPNTPDTDAVFTSANFEAYEHATYGPTFKVVSGMNEVSDLLVELIMSANQSIHVASGHLRSRPVYEALIAKYEQDPNLDIRIYLDGQEYTSKTTYDNEIADVEDCLQEAGDSESKQQACLDKGVHYAYPVQDAGIDLRFKYYAYRWNYSYAKQMHHKYFIFDKSIVVSGSYNLSDNAEHNTTENMSVFSGAAYPNIIAAFEENFEEMWITGREDDDKLYYDLMDLIENTDNPIPIVFDSMSLDWLQVYELKSAIINACPEVNSYEFRTEPTTHTVCYR